MNRLHNRRLALSSFVVLLSSGIVLILTLLRGLLIPSLIAPRVYGLWQTLLFIPTYTGYSDLGVNHSMLRRVPGLKLGGNTKDVEIYVSNALWATTIFSILVCFIFIAIGILFENTGNPTYVHAFAVMVVNIIFAQIHRHYSFYIRATQLFVLLSILRVIYPLISVIGSVALFLLFGFIGLPYGLLVANIAVCLFFIYWIGLPSLSSIKVSVVMELLKDGFLLFLIPMFTMLIMGLDRILVLSLYSAESLGIYAVAVFITGMLLIIPESIATTFLPNMLEVSSKYSNGDVDLKSLLRRSMEWISSLSAVFAGLIIIGCPVLITNFLPKYEDAMDLTAILLASYFPLALSTTLVNTLIAQNSVRFIIFAQLLCLVIIITLNGIAYFLGYGIIGVAWATFVALWFYYFMLVIYTYFILAVMGDLISDMFRNISLITYCVLLGMGILLLWDNFDNAELSKTVQNIGLGVMGYAIGVSPILWRLFKTRDSYM